MALYSLLLGDLNAQDLANSLLAYAKMGRAPAAELHARLEHEVARKRERRNREKIIFAFCEKKLRRLRRQQPAALAAAAAVACCCSCSAGA
jgi:hypothetical protein